MVYEGFRNRKDAQEIFAIEHQVSVQRETSIMIYDGAKITLISVNTNPDLRKIQYAKHKANKIIRLTNDTFVTMDETCHKLRLLVARYINNGF